MLLVVDHSDGVIPGRIVVQPDAHAAADPGLVTKVAVVLSLVEHGGIRHVGVEKKLAHRLLREPIPFRGFEMCQVIDIVLDVGRRDASVDAADRPDGVGVVLALDEEERATDAVRRSGHCIEGVPPLRLLHRGVVNRS